MSKFKPGDRVIFDPGVQGSSVACAGAAAIVGPRGIYSGGRYLDVVWVRDHRAANQKDGGYYPYSFRLAEDQE